MAAAAVVSSCSEGPVTVRTSVSHDLDEFPSLAGQSALNPPDLHATSGSPTAMAVSTASGCSEGPVTIRTSVSLGESGARGPRPRSWRASGSLRCGGSALPTLPPSSSSAPLPSRPQRMTLCVSRLYTAMFC